MQWPSLNYYYISRNSFEGCVDSSQWATASAGLELMDFYKQPAGNSKLTGRFPSFTDAAFRLILRHLVFSYASLSGELNVTPLKALSYLCITGCDRMTKLTMQSVATLVTFFGDAGTLPLWRDMDLNGSTITQAMLNTLLQNIDGNALSNGTIDARVAGGVKASGAGALAITAMTLRGYTILENP